MDDISHAEVVSMLQSIPPDSLTYDAKFSVMAAFKSAGGTNDECLQWCSQSAHYDEQESLKHIQSITAAGNITIGTLAYYARANGWQGELPTMNENERNTDAAALRTLRRIPRIEPPRVDVPEPLSLPIKEHIKRYLSALFRADEWYCVVTNAAYDEKRQKWHPDGRGTCQSVAYATSCLNTDKSVNPGDVFCGDPKTEAGVWVRVNPVSAGGAADTDVTAYRNTLLESDAMTKEQAIQWYHDHKIPCAAIVDSGGKSVHAIVRIDARDRAEYDERVSFLYDYCAANGFEVDKANRNPSRLSRLPGVVRGESRQRLLYLDTGCENFTEWRAWVDRMQEQLSGELPPFVPIDDITGVNLPERPPVLIEGVLSAGSKMLIAAPSKAGKSFLAIQLAISLATGGEWLGWQCKQSRVLYINLELKEETFAQRISAAIEKLGLSVQDVSGWLTTWHLRGKVTNMAEINAELERKAEPGQFDAVIIDPIYKVTNGDENSAQEMAVFTHELDRLLAMDCAVIGIHHFSKGAKGAYVAMDRLSGSGVFARDADALITMTPLVLPCEGCDAGREWLEKIEEENGEDAIPCRVEYTLREFRMCPPQNVVFCFPMHYIDDAGTLDSALIEGSRGEGQYRGGQTRKKQCDAQRKERIAAILEAMAACNDAGEAQTIRNIYCRLEDPFKAHGIQKPTYHTFSNYFGKSYKSMPFHCEGVIVVYEG